MIFLKQSETSNVLFNSLQRDTLISLPSLNNLGISFSRRFERTGELSDISEAIPATLSFLSVA